MAKHKQHPDTPQDAQQDAPGAATQALVIAGLTFTIGSPYAEGHPLTAGEARALNQTRAENLRNNFAKTVTAAKGDNATVSDETKAELDAKLATYESEYSFEKVRSSSPRAAHVDPVEREALRQGAIFVEAALNAKGIAKKSVKPDNFKVLVQEVLTKRPEIREAARRHIEALHAIGHEAIASLEDSNVELNDVDEPALVDGTAE
jgi:hypothetical protein